MATCGEDSSSDDMRLIDFCCIHQNLVAGLDSVGGLYLGRISAEDRSIIWEFHSSIAQSFHGWTKELHKALSYVQPNNVSVLFECGSVGLIDISSKHSELISIPDSVISFLEGDRNEYSYINNEGLCVKVKGGTKKRQVSGQWSRFTRLFSSNGYLLAEGCTGECSWYSIAQILAHSTPINEPVLGKAILVGGFRSFLALSPCAEGVMLGLDASGEMYRYHLCAATDSSGRPAYSCEPTLLCSDLLVPRISGYAWPLSVNPGQKISLHLSGYGDAVLELIDLVYDRPLFDTEPNKYALTLKPRKNGKAKNGACDWPSTVDIQIPDNIKSTLATARVTGVDGDVFDVVFIIPQTTGKGADQVNVLISTNTWCAYNSWGGISKYGPNQPDQLSFKRPNPAVSPIWDGFPNHLLVSDLWAIKSILGMGFDLAFVTDFDFENFQVNEIPCPLILLSHPEYWTISSRKKLDQFAENGGYLIYLGGNGVFEACDLSSCSTALDVFVAGGNPDRAKSYFRNLTPPMPERELLGIAFRYDIDWKADPVTHIAGAYVVDDSNHWAFDGLDVVDGSLIGEHGRNGGGACGWEMDTSDPGIHEGGVVTARGNNDRGAPPKHTKIIARGFQNSMTDNFGAHIAVLERPDKKGGIFSVGSICFCGSLIDDYQLQKMISNVIEKYLREFGEPNIR